MLPGLDKGRKRRKEKQGEKKKGTNRRNGKKRGGKKPGFSHTGALASQETEQGSPERLGLTPLN